MVLVEDNMVGRGDNTLVSVEDTGKVHRVAVYGVCMEVALAL